ncbi:ABC transporter ATP-binding protein [Amycolatopsis rubida]|uniref:ABC transporter ATP-binding protein n=1 Tax=Amycolatopsis rubida TaxID=112413 RepID=A0A1I5UXZ0_9PSEU|nr:MULTISPECIES: ABC transporter ATP-binding protein [Amycolatopsis]MYW90315.1 ATP-binding cassette domain-containing protein [Amycolatopsis rubida]NEC55292.1 ABC transporter ATP-binding protein [Amycolatopsis rubida]OAP26912.1 putative multidrug export ATP-binding/permease protein [Amycolatopsis sp. M39]SFQ00068.1 ATP-binding cassette, subfamily B [Amycolatopsis rubida]
MLVKLLRSYLRPYRAVLWLVVALQLVQTIAALYLPTLNADIIDGGLVKGDTGYIVKIGGVMLLITLVQIAGSIGAVYYGSRTAAAVGRDIRAGVFHRVQDFSAREIGTFGTPSLITRTTNDVQQIQLLAGLTFTLMVSAPIMCVGGILLALQQDVPLSSLLVVIVPVLGVAIGLIVMRMRSAFRLMQVRLDRINQVMREQIMGIRVIRAFVRDKHERERFGRANDELFTVSLRVGRLIALMFPTVMLVVNVSSVAVLWFGGQRVDSGAMQIGALTAFLAYLLQILMAVMMATFMFMMVPRAEVSAERITEVLDTESSVRPPDEPVAAGAEHGHLDLTGVEFRYPGAEKPVLQDVSLFARPGETTAIIGSTGSGKTTLLNLIPRLMDATEGSVRVDGVDVRRLDPAVLSSVVSMVPQKPYLFAGTVASNLRYGNPDATDEQLWHALEVAQGKDFVERMEQGLDSPIAQGGTNVSGGQRQRLAIARMLVHRPEIYLFDDSFSALDYATDAALRRALAGETRDATVVIVAQRVSTIRGANRIIVLDDGRVVGTGTHHELMDTNATYREIVLSQLTEQEAA